MLSTRFLVTTFRSTCSRSAQRTGGATALLALAAALTGCVDAASELEDFNQRYDKANPPIDAGPGCGHAACTPPGAGELQGNYLMALSAKLSPTKPIVILANLTTAAGTAPSGVTVSMNLQALKASDRMTPTGTPIDIGPFDIGKDGMFTTPTLGPLNIPGDANSIQPGVPIVASPTLCGHVCSDEPDFLCGDVGGEVTSPLMLPLDGSHFTMQAITGATYPAPVIDCNKTPAAPL